MLRMPLLRNTLQNSRHTFKAVSEVVGNAALNPAQKSTILFLMKLKLATFTTSILLENNSEMY